jgi:hypothetical protein
LFRRERLYRGRIAAAAEGVSRTTASIEVASASPLLPQA